jgi:hypothetical protein
MRALAGIIAFLVIIMIAVIMLITEWLKKRKDNFK